MTLSLRAKKEGRYLSLQTQITAKGSWTCKGKTNAQLPWWQGDRSARDTYSKSQPESSLITAWISFMCLAPNCHLGSKKAWKTPVRCARQHEISLQPTQNPKVQSAWLLSWVALSLFWGNIFAFASTNAFVCDSSVSFSDLFSWVGWESMNPLSLVTKLSVVLCPFLCLREFDTTLHTERPLEEFVHRCHGFPRDKYTPQEYPTRSQSTQMKGITKLVAHQEDVNVNNVTIFLLPFNCSFIKSCLLFHYNFNTLTNAMLYTNTS